MRIAPPSSALARRAGTPHAFASLILAGLLACSAPAEPPRPAVDLPALESAFQDLVAQVSPSVVGIRAYRRIPSGAATESTAGPENAQLVLVNGSGTIIAESGLILTNEHVVQATTDIQVLLHDGAHLPATVLAADPRSDLAVLRIDRTGLPAARFCDWAAVRRGQWSLVLGNPVGLAADGQLSVAVGVVSNLGRELPGLGETDDRFYHDMVQTTAPISPGHSGGPLFNIRGELLGVVTAMHTRAPADEGIGFAIPASPAKRRIIAVLCSGQTVEYGDLGFETRPLGEHERRRGVPENGVVVQHVERGGPAEAAALRVEDLVQSFDGRLVRSAAQLTEWIGETEVGRTVRLGILRDGQRGEVELTVRRRPAPLAKR